MTKQIIFIKLINDVVNEPVDLTPGVPPSKPNRTRVNFSGGTSSFEPGKPASNDEIAFREATKTGIEERRQAGLEARRKYEEQLNGNNNPKAASKDIRSILKGLAGG